VLDFDTRIELRHRVSDARKARLRIASSGPVRECSHCGAPDLPYATGMCNDCRRYKTEADRLEARRRTWRESRRRRVRRGTVDGEL
jgi:hypothetical protein